MLTPDHDKKTQYTMPRIKYIIAIASGKGGVGKSTITTNLALAFANQGHKVGILDADIYGPSIPHMLDLSGKPEIDAESKMIPHLFQHPTQPISILANSIGFIVDEKTAASWRGPMASKALFQLFFQTAWGELDYLFIDMPPGTGDIQLSLASKIPVSACILVTTPQEVALLDVRKSADLFRKVRVPIIGIIENMSYFIDPVSHQPHYIFGKDGGKKLADELNIPLIGQVPLDPNITQSAELGTIPLLPIFDQFASIIAK